MGLEYGMNRSQVEHHNHKSVGKGSQRLIEHDRDELAYRTVFKSQ